MRYTLGRARAVTRPAPGSPRGSCGPLGPDAADPTVTRAAVLLTDGSTDALRSAMVEFGALELVAAPGEGSASLTDYGGRHELLGLRHGATASLALARVEPRRYVGLRMQVLDAAVALAEGWRFCNGSTTARLPVPPGARSGVTVTLGARGRGRHASDGVVMGPGETIIVVDFDVSQNFHLDCGMEGWSGVTDVAFTPKLRATTTDVAGSISGVVTSVFSGRPVAGAVVRGVRRTVAPLPERETPEVTAVTDEAGAYTLWYLEPGAYDVAVDGFLAEAASVTVGPAIDVVDVHFSGTY